MSRIGRKGGMSLSTGFDVSFDFKNSAFPTEYYKDENKEVVHMLCDEAQLPNVQSAVGQVNGRVLGEGSVSYPHTRLFTDLSMGFLCDAELIPMKFFNSWYEFIYGEGLQKVHTGSIEDAQKVTPRGEYRVNRLKYMDDYVATIKIVKTEPNWKASNDRAPIVYMLENAYPYSIDSVPLAYGTSQVTRVNVNFYYSRHSVAYAQNKKLEADDMDYDDPAFGNYGTTANTSGEKRGEN